MKIGISPYSQAPSDEEIDRDVLELRRLLDGIDGPKEPHPAYWQNFLVHVHERIDEDRFRRRRWSPSLAWGSLSAAAVAAILVVTGVIPTSFDRPTVAPRVVAQGPVKEQAGTQLVAFLDSHPDSKSLMLTEQDTKMLAAIESNDDDAILSAMIDGQI